MINQVNPGALVPFYSGATAVWDHTRHLTAHADGWRILASSRRLIPFIIWEDAAPKTVTAFQVVHLATGKIYDLSTSLITRQKRADDSRTWYFFTDAGIGTELPCGDYRVRLNLNGTTYISDVLEVANIAGPESIRLNASGCASNVLTLAASDSVAGAISYVRTEYRISNATSWTNLPASAGPPYEYQIDMGAISLPAGENLLIRRTLFTDSGNTLQILCALDWNSADPCGTYTFFQIEDLSSYVSPYWAITLSDSKTWEDKVYKAGFQEKAYLRAHFDFPEAEREIETLVSNTGNRILSSAQTREYLALDFERVPDQFIYPLTAIGDYSTVTLDHIAREYQITVPGAECEFTVEGRQTGYYSRGRLRWRNNQHYESACVTGETTSTP